MMYENVKFNFGGKRALVTGAARGIGRDIALKLAHSGAETFALDINKEGLDLLRTEHSSIHTVCIDLRDWEATRKAVEALTPIDLLVNVAGVIFSESLLDVKSDSFDTTLAVNTKAPLNLCQIVAKDLISRKRPGSFVNISSSLSKKPLNNAISYNVSKAAINMVTKSLANDLGQFQIRVNSILPTVVKTEMTRHIYEDPEKTEKFLSRIPLERFAEVRDIAGPVMFLLSDAASMITGHLLLVDGGSNIS